MATLKSTRLGTTDLLKDPAEILKDYIKSAFDATTDPPASECYFSTKWDRLDKHCIVVVENMLQPIRIEDNGSGRYQYDDKFRVQVLANRNIGKDRRWKMEKIITSKINANRTGMQVDGIDEAFISEFVPIASVSIDANNLAVQDTTVERSYAICTLRYYKYVS